MHQPVRDGANGHPFDAEAIRGGVSGEVRKNVVGDIDISKFVMQPYHEKTPLILLVLCVVLMFTIIAVDFFVWQDERPQEYIRISRDFNEDRRKKTL